ncbi:hypothetical protein LR007_01700 [candidate division NPL-UPA2 bacterium]|nr:hypothetical protein [candidate division NPL-UPA2 bacterium]
MPGATGPGGEEEVKKGDEEMRWIEYDEPEKEKERIEKVISENPNDANAHYELGTVYAYFDFARARECAEKAIELDPENILFWAFFAYACANNGADQDAIEALTKLIELGADTDDYYVDMATAAECGMDNELAWHQIEELRNSGKEEVAKKLEKWLI